MSEPILAVENLGKRFRLGQIGASSFREEVEKYFAKRRRRRLERKGIAVDDPFADDNQVSGQDFWALRDIDFSVKQGEVLGIIGHNGAGKSTLLKILSRITEPTTGRITMNGRVGSLLEVGTGFHPELSGRENIYLNGAILGMRKHEIDRKMDEIVAFAGVENFLDTPVKRFSTGMSVRLGFAVAAHLEPEILIIDEVLAVGDASFQRRCIEKMQAVAREGRTILFVSHQMESVIRLCDRVIVLKKGQIDFQGDTDEAVQSYLAQNRVAGSRRAEFPDAPELPAFLKAAEVLVEGKRAQETLDVEDPLLLDIEYQVNEPLQFSNIGITLTRDNTVLARSWDVDNLPELFERREPGHYKARIRLPRQLLTKGTYQVTLGIGIPKQGAIQAYERAVEFTLDSIESDSTFKSYDRGGMVRIDPQWDYLESPQLAHA